MHTSHVTLQHHLTVLQLQLALFEYPTLQTQQVVCFPAALNLRFLGTDTTSSSSSSSSSSMSGGITIEVGGRGKNGKYKCRLLLLLLLLMLEAVRVLRQ